MHTKPKYVKKPVAAIIATHLWPVLLNVYVDMKNYRDPSGKMGLGWGLGHNSK